MKNLILFRKLAKNKKGLDDDLTDIILAVVFTAIIFIFVFLFFTSTNRSMENSAMEKSKNLENTYVLLNYLRSPKDEEVNIGEYMGFLKKNELEKKCDFLKEETNKVLEDVEDWRAIIYIDEKEFCRIEKGKGKNEELGDITGETVRALIPSIDPEVESIEIYFKLNVFGFSLLSSI